MAAQHTVQELGEFRHRVAAAAAGKAVARELVSSYNRDGQASLFLGVSMETNLNKTNAWKMQIRRQHLHASTFKWAAFPAEVQAAAHHFILTASPASISRLVTQELPAAAPEQLRRVQRHVRGQWRLLAPARLAWQQEGIGRAHV